MTIKITPIPDIELLVIFSILMQNNSGIISKSPGYIMEKFLTVARSDNTGLILGLLDKCNKQVFNNWCERWKNKALDLSEITLYNNLIEDSILGGYKKCIAKEKENE